MAINAVRTADELRDISFNYFIAFKIDLKETDKTIIDPTIKKWLSVTKGDVYSRRLIELKTDILEIMVNDSVLDPATGTYKPNAGGRAKEAQAAKNLKIKEAIDVVQRVCLTRTTIFTSEIKKIYDTANSPVEYFTEAEFDVAIKPLLASGVNLVNNLDASIPFDKYQKSEQYLKTINKKDLYDFLGCDNTASKQVLEEKSGNQYKESQKIIDKGKKQAMGSLCALVKELILASPEAKKNYDNYLALKDDVWEDFEKRKAFGIKDISIDEYGEYAKKIMDILKVKVGEAEKMLAVACKFFLFTLIGGNQTGGTLFEICPHPDCGLLIKKGSKTCPHCGKALEVLCWNCNQQMPLSKDDKGCPSCGATYFSHKDFLNKCSVLENLLTQQEVDISKLKSAFLNIENVVPNYKSKTSSVIYKKAQEYAKSISEKEKLEENTGKAYRADVTKVRELISQKKYQTAYSSANSLQTKYGTYNIENTKKLIAEIMQVISAAQKNVEAAKQYAAQNNEGVAVAYAVKALDACVDYTEATQILKKFPPKPVVNLKNIVDGNKVRLEWEDRFKQDYTTYTIIKKIGVAPINVEDGALVEKGLSIKFYEDQNVISATPYFYSVFTERYGIQSVLCTTPTPSLIYSDVLNVQQDFVTSGIKVSWEAPQNVKSIEVWKKSGPVAPLNVGDGVKITCDNKGFYDDKCVGENAYLIVCNYQVKDKIVQSKGLKVVYKPYEKTTPLENVVIEALDVNKYSFSCDEGYTGNISLYYANAKMPIQTNTVLKYIDFNTICKGLTKIPTSLTVDGKISFTIPQGRIGQVYPIVATEQLFVVSPPHLVNTMEGMNANHTVSNGVVSITGTLHPKASSVVVKVSNDKYAEKITDGGENFIFKKDVLIKQGKLDIKLKTNTVNYITIFVEFIEDSIKTYSQPVKLNPPIDYRESVNVLYSLSYKASAVKPYTVTISFEADKETVIPALLLMKGQPKPMNKTAGQLCEKLDPITLKKGLFSKKFTGKHVVKVSATSINTKYAVFVSEGGEHVKLKEVKQL